MSVLPPSLFEALDSDPSLWPGRLTAAGRAALESSFGRLPTDVRDALVSAMVAPERSAWTRAAALGLTHAATAGAVATGMATDDLVEMQDRRGERFGLQPVGFQLPPEPWGDGEAVRRLLRGLDVTFDHRRYVLYLRRPVPPDIDVAPICRAVQLWLGQVDRGDRGELHAVYEDGEVQLDLTVIPGAHGGGGRVLTVGPVASLELLGVVDGRLVEAASRSEESIGSLPLVMVAGADRPWGLSRGFVQQLLFGTADRVESERGPGIHRYEAEFTPNGRSLFSDPACRAIASLWWLESAPADGPLAYRSQVYDNPWAKDQPMLPVVGPRFTPVGDADRSGRVVLRWEGWSDRAPVRALVEALATPAESSPSLSDAPTDASVTPPIDGPEFEAEPFDPPSEETEQPDDAPVASVATPPAASRAPGGSPSASGTSGPSAGPLVAA
ncbi:MAG: hypothetical protein ABMB14_05715, partial [Myxococcota bacterium]